MIVIFKITVPQNVIFRCRHFRATEAKSKTVVSARLKKLGLKVLGGYLEEALRMGTNGADFGSLFADHDVTAV